MGPLHDVGDNVIIRSDLVEYLANNTDVDDDIIDLCGKYAGMGATIVRIVSSTNYPYLLDIDDSVWWEDEDFEEDGYEYEMEPSEFSLDFLFE